MIDVGELMSTDLVTLPATASVWQARKLMAEKRIRHIPVVNGENEFVGLLTQRDVLAASVSVLADVDGQDLTELESGIPVEAIMTTQLTVVEKDTDLLQAARYLFEHKLGCLPVVDRGNLVGILTESDFLKLVIHMLERVDAAAAESAEPSA